ncbi:hypothetical protein [Paracidovorax valerianellae]|uniref:hypothetical protein n=1 Tax=Paracidovorax valerianellae TaxID=187868 RepID=UPI002303F71A|nr:hypothetical protein [Paracidovorax valerianellae]MDA8446352.1 hypothetical protein [Paracidovorax valerianellae]
MSDKARRLLQYRYWLDGLMARPARSDWYERDLYLTESSLRDQAAYIIGRDC